MNCVLVNLTITSLEVGCTAGRDGGRQQWFKAQVYAATTHRLLATLEETTPRFRVDGLTPGQDYLITVTAVNDKGASRPMEISAVRLKASSSHKSTINVLINEAFQFVLMPLQTI